MERMLITKIVSQPDGKVELYARGHKFRDTLLFDASDLMEVGIDPNELEPGQPVAVRFWALYELSEKVNASGNPYKDIVALEPTDKPATSSSVDQSAVLEELRAIRSLLERALMIGPPTDGTPITAPPEPPLSRKAQEKTTGETATAPADPFAWPGPREREPQPTEAQPAGRDPLPVGGLTGPAGPTGDPYASMDDGQAKRQFFSLAGGAVKSEQLEPGRVNALSKTAKDTGWVVALRSLDLLINRAQTT